MLRRLSQDVVNKGFGAAATRRDLVFFCAAAIFALPNMPRLW
jgi:hypothetical protein